ncbi:APC family permease [Paenibacillus sp. GCM10027628]|uniref:APC family permease n=1 Tax=Paenibacillus sp. GCM10027628 TaxID=3273413 RepID=UPI003644B34E
MENQFSLRRTLTLFPVVIFGLAYMAPMTVFGTYGVAALTSHGMLPAAYIIALVAMLFTAFSYGPMVRAYPVAGSAYTYTQKSISPHVGFLVGWAILMDYLFLPMINILLNAIYLSAAFPAIPMWVWIVAWVFILTLVNILGIKVTTSLNVILIAFQVLVLVLFVIFSIKGIAGGMGTGTFFSSLPFYNPEVSFSYVLAGAAILCLSFLGFDSVTMLSEETLDAKKTIPKAVVLTALIGGLLCIFVSYVSHMVFPDYNSFANPDSASLEIAERIGGTLFSSVFLAGLITTGVASGLSSHASVSRLLFAMGRDGVLPQKIFGYIHPKYKTPVYNVILIGLFSLSALFLDLVTAASFINFGALVAFTFVNLSVIFCYYIKQRRRSAKETVCYLIFPVIGALFNIWLWTNLDKHAMILGIVWAACGFVYLLYLTKMFGKRPPEIHFESTESAADSKTVAM